MFLLLLSHSAVSNSFWPHGLYSLPGSAVHGIIPEYCSGLPFLPPEDLPDPGIGLMSSVAPALAGRFFYYWVSHLGSLVNQIYKYLKNIMLYTSDESFLCIFLYLILQLNRINKVLISKSQEGWANKIMWNSSLNYNYTNFKYYHFLS